MKTLFLNLILLKVLIFFSSKHDEIILSYVDFDETELKEAIKLDLTSSDPLQNVENLLLDLEDFLKKEACKNGFTLIKIQLIERVDNQIATESQSGNHSSISVLYKMDK